MLRITPSLRGRCEVTGWATWVKASQGTWAAHCSGHRLPTLLHDLSAQFLSLKVPLLVASQTISQNLQRPRHPDTERQTMLISHWESIWQLNPKWISFFAQKYELKGFIPVKVHIWRDDCHSRLYCLSMHSPVTCSCPFKVFSSFSSSSSSFLPPPFFLPLFFFTCYLSNLEFIHARQALYLTLSLNMFFFLQKTRLYIWKKGWFSCPEGQVARILRLTSEKEEGCVCCWIVSVTGNPQESPFLLS